MIIESVRIVAPSAKREEVRRALTALSGPIEAEAGCISCRVLQESSDQHAFCYEAQWKSQDDLLRHIRSEHYRRLLVLMDMGDEAPLVEFHIVAETRGLDLIEHARNVVG